ncbi:ppk20 [Drosophila busckii]|uniref:Ppk20 n=1 Tax=Drosophila busckii TaxID=30019 RepID=A0A0M4EE32_DROBS|nr:ppk20 [Drosophila busckii]
MVRSDNAAKSAATSSASGSDKRFTVLLSDYFRYYCDRSTIHCVRYLYDPRLHNVERLIWCVLLVISVTLCCSFFMLLSERYNAQKLQTVIEDPQYPVFYVEFPAVAVCTENRINWSKLEAAKTQFLPVNASEELVTTFTELIILLETLRFNSFENNMSELEDLNLEALDFINLIDLVHFMALRCEDILLPGSCTWNFKQFKCCDYFMLEKTEYGLCLVYNSETSFASQAIKQREGSQYYPKHNAKSGQASGLRFNLLVDERFKRPASRASDIIYIMIKRPKQITNVVYSIIPHTETLVTVRPQLTSTDENTRHIDPKRRNCQFPNEQHDFGVSDSRRRYDRLFLQLNCYSYCHESYLVKLCNCSLPFFFANNENDIFAYDKHYEEDNYFSDSKPGMTCPCLVSCNLLEYYTSTTTLPLTMHTIHNLTERQKLYKVDVHYQVEMMITYRTSLEFSSIDLIANLGGIFGLCLGASMVSGVELLYSLTVGFALHLYDHAYYAVLRVHWQQKWRNWQRYLHNEFVVNQQNVAATTEALHTNNKLRHPFKARANAW